jgi:hypothetical protein
MLLDKVRPLYFFAAFAVGLLACYVMAPRPEVVVKFPSPYNAGSVVYEDRAHNCYTYEASQVACPRDASSVRPQPVVSEAPPPR